MRASGGAVFSVLDLREIGTRDVMTVMEKAFGKKITTRSWGVIISNAGHVSNIEQPERFNAEVREFCLAVDAGR